jgi:LacI family transcriptional regulator
MPRHKERVTIADVAERAAVSTMTVSRVLNNKGEISEETRQHVLQVMDELGYRPNRVARSLATDKTLKIGIIVPSLSSAYFGSILEGVENVLWENGYNILLCNTANNVKREQAVLELFEEDRVDGVIVFSSRLPVEELNAYLNNQRAAVLLNSLETSAVAGCVFVDEHASIALAVNHLLASGRRHLAFIGLRQQTFATRERARGFQHALADAGLPFDAERQMATLEHARDQSAPITALLRQNPYIDGLVCFNDEIAARALRSCACLGRRVPDDMAVVGYDDIFLAELLTPTLTTLRLKLTKQEVGAQAARMLLERMEGDQSHAAMTLHHELIVRESAP